uniref:Cyanate hydratase n=1 Tax=Globodera rostochiensis TaxID=31243 RepID=A0A914HVY6_GLORO
MANISSAQLLSAPIKSRHEVIEQIYAQKVRLGLRWAAVAAQIGLSKEWTTAACLGQMQMNAEEADKLVASSNCRPSPNCGSKLLGVAHTPQT